MQHHDTSSTPRPTTPKPSHVDDDTPLDDAAIRRALALNLNGAAFSQNGYETPAHYVRPSAVSRPSFEITHPHTQAHDPPHEQHQGHAVSLRSPFGSQKASQYSLSGLNTPGFDKNDLKRRGSTRSIMSTLSTTSLSSVALNQQISDVTALPSPVNATFQDIGWNHLVTDAEGAHPRVNLEKELPPLPVSPTKKKAYSGLIAEHEASRDLQSHGRSRSQSEYVPPAPLRRIARPPTVSGTQVVPAEPKKIPSLHREDYLAVQRGIASIPTPPRSKSSISETSEPEQETRDSPPGSPRRVDSRATTKRYEARMLKSGRMRSWNHVRQLGTGTFSTVQLATSADSDMDESSLPPRSLVAVKVCEHGPAGGADEAKIETSLRRELEILQSIRHPTLVHLCAVSVLEKQALLVLNYCAGGDLFELASTKHAVFTPVLIRRMFAETVDAVKYLHGKGIVHRDIKLENVLVNLPLSELTVLAALPDFLSYPYPIITLTDLGLSRYIPAPPASPLLTTRCGSEDYAAPEILIGSEYDGRMTDAWALGVLLYAMMEGRLPFDPVPNARRQSPTSHRIARCEWQWVKYGDEDDEWDEVKGRDLEGGKTVVEGLLCRVRSRLSVEKVSELGWVSGAIECGLRTRYDVDEDEW